MSMTEPRGYEARGEQIVGVRFRTRASADEVVARLLEAVRRTDLFLLNVVGDGDRVYPFEGRNPARSASSWRAELFWRSPAKPAWQLEVFLRRAGLLLDLPDGVRLELRGGQRNPRRGGRGGRPARPFGARDDARPPLHKKT